MNRGGELALQGATATHRSRQTQSVKHLTPRICVEPDEQCFADTHCGSPQVSGRAQHQGRQRVTVRLVLLQVHLSDFLTLGDDQCLDTLQQRQGVVSTVTLLASIDFRSDRDGAGRKKLLRARTRRSAPAVIAPVDRDSHPMCLLKKKWEPVRENHEFPARPVPLPQCDSQVCRQFVGLQIQLVVS